MLISVYEPMPMSAVSFYRSIGTMQYLPRLNKNIKIVVPKTIDWTELLTVDLFYMQRPNNSEHDLKAFEIARELGIPIWVDYDDLLHEIPKYNPSYGMYSDPQRKKNMEYFIEKSDIVTVSTPEIKNYYSKFNPNIVVIPNAYNDFHFPLQKITDQYNVITWRGSGTHRDDLRFILGEMERISNDNPEWEWIFLGGSDIWYIKEKIRTHQHFQECDLITYLRFIQKVRAAVQINPLLNNAFNRGKSNISYFEATYAGSVLIAPDLPEFKDLPGCLIYDNNDPVAFGNKLEKAMRNGEYRMKNYKKSFDHIQNNMILSKINQKRIDLIEERIK